MPFKLTKTNCLELVVDNEYEITDIDLLVEYVSNIILGKYKHILKIINLLSSNPSTSPNHVIDVAIEKLNVSGDTNIAHRDGWLFQMISWLALAHNNLDKKYFTQQPHIAKAQHGIDGLSIVLKDDNSIDKIIITEDKCTTNPRDMIREKVFPEFKDFEEGKKDSTLISIISSLLDHLDEGGVYESIENDIYNIDFRKYRIGITREKTHNETKGRLILFKDYDEYVLGDTNVRRSGASIYFEDVRSWFQDFTELVIKCLESKKS